jgi:hypothetical protein
MEVLPPGVGKQRCNRLREPVEAIDDRNSFAWIFRAKRRAEAAEVDTVWPLARAQVEQACRLSE